MTEYRVPHEVVYETDELVSISDVVESLLGIERILKDVGPVLEICIPGVVVSKIDVSVHNVSQNSPLSDGVIAAIFLVFQKDLEAEVPESLGHLLGWKWGHEHPTIVTVLFLVILCYGADYAYKKLVKAVEKSHIEQQLDGLIKEAAIMCNTPEDKIRAFLAGRYGKGRAGGMVRSCLGVFLPSKNHGNAAMIVGKRRIEPTLIAQVPGEAQMLDFDDPPETQPMQNVDIELHAQDKDRTKRGWAGVIPAVTKSRLRMELYPPISPADIYTKERIKGDIILVRKRKPSGDMEPSSFHLVRIHD
jgi:hypothetical protein